MDRAGRVDIRRYVWVDVGLFGSPDYESCVVIECNYVAYRVANTRKADGGWKMRDRMIPSLNIIAQFAACLFVKLN